ncbi:MAG: branched-chain amino acid transporter permease, partial [Acidimicrobiales bacterium]|nr:branched-chain amino acid transporter permease [Acidimicrobiales bacterium]
MSTLDAPDAGSAGLVSAEAAAELAQPVGGGGRLPWVRIAVGIVLAAVALYLPFYYGPDTNKLLSQAIYLAVAAQGLNLLTGFNGQVSIGHGAFFGVGAFTTGILMTEYG